jgi:hypothetical protein
MLKVDVLGPDVSGLDVLYECMYVLYRMNKVRCKRYGCTV